MFFQEVLSVVASLGTPNCKGFSPELLQYVRTAVYDGFHIKKDYDKKRQVRFDYILLETLLENAKRPGRRFSEC